MTTLNRCDGKVWVKTTTGWLEMSETDSNYFCSEDFKYMGRDFAEVSGRFRFLTKEETLEAENEKASVEAPSSDPLNNVEIPEPNRPDRTRANWLLSPLSSFGRLSIQKEQYEELRAEARGLREEKEALKKRILDLEADVEQRRKTIEVRNMTIRNLKKGEL